LGVFEMLDKPYNVR